MTWRKFCYRLATSGFACITPIALQVFMAVFDIMVSHYNMTRWHEAGLTHHKTDLAALQAAKLACKQRLLMQSPQQPASTNEGDCQDPPGVGRPPVGSAAVITQLVAVEQPKDDPRAVPRPAVVGTGLSGELSCPSWSVAQSVPSCGIAYKQNVLSLAELQTPARAILLHKTKTKLWRKA